MFSVRRISDKWISRGQKGFTLIELMIALLILALLMTAIYRVFSSQERMFRTQAQVSALQENLRATIEYVNQELTWMGYQVPGLAVITAAESDVIFKANIPNTGGTIQYVRYTFDPSTNTISRAAGPAATDVESADLTVMADDIASLSFSYINVLNGVLTATDADPLVAAELGGTDDGSLVTIQRIKARVTARTSRPDWNYTHPASSTDFPWGGGNYRTRSAVLDLKARNAEDVTLVAGQVATGTCGWLEHTITVPGGIYYACPDKDAIVGGGAPDLSDNPYVTINAFDKDGNINTNAGRTVYVFASSGPNSPYNMHDISDPWTQDNVIDSGETLYVSAQELSDVSVGQTVTLEFGYLDGVCTQITYAGSTSITVAPSAASQFNTTSPYVDDAMIVDYLRLSDQSPVVLTDPVQIGMCSSVSDIGARMTIQVIDDCYNPIAGEGVSWSDGGVGGQFASTDNSDGSYTAIYTPPDSMGSPSASYAVSVSATWGAETHSNVLTLVPSVPYDIVIDSIEEITPSTFQFSSIVPPRASQLGNNSGSDFTIERVDGQEVRVTFHLEDECGNRIYNQVPNMTISPSAGTYSSLSEGSGASYSFMWESDEGCGAAVSGEDIEILVSSITNVPTQDEIIGINLLETRSGPDAGPWVQLTASPDQLLVAGDTTDFAIITASVMQYNPGAQKCTNIPGRFLMDFEVVGASATQTGSFSNLTPFDEITTQAYTNTITGMADVNLYSGTAHWNDTLTVNADATVGGATYSGSLGLDMEASTPGAASGLYSDALYNNKTGFVPAGIIDRAYDPGDTIYIRVFDFDENENPIQVDSQTSPFNVEVTISSLKTGDIETIGLTESNTNTALFENSISSIYSTTYNLGDGQLQVEFGDTITMYYEDRNDSGENETWQAYTSGPDTMTLHKWLGVGSTTPVFSAGVQVVDLTYGDKIQPRLFFPEFSGDGILDTTTKTLHIVSLADDDDILVLRETADTGIFLPDQLVYTGPYFTLSKTDAPDQVNRLATPTTPRYITVTYDDPGVTVLQQSVYLKDGDPPTVSISAPLSGATVASDVLVTVTVSDFANTTATAGINQIDLMINGRVIQTILTGADLSPSQDFTWTTRSGTTPLWLDGSHEISARAFDNARNSATSAAGDVIVTLDNDLRALEFDQPAFSSIWSQSVDVDVMVSTMDTSWVISDVFLAYDASLATMTSIGGGLYRYTLDTTAVSEGSLILTAYIRDEFGNIDLANSAQMDFVVDRTPPVIGLSALPTWIVRTDFPLNLGYPITEVAPNSVDPASVTATFTGACNSPIDMPYSSAVGSTYSFAWAGTTCVTGPGVEGSLTLTVKAADIASLANTTSSSVTTSIDTVNPIMGSTISVATLQSSAFSIDLGSVIWTVAGFIRDDVTITASVTDSYPNSGQFSMQYYADPGVITAPTSWGSALSTSLLDATSGTFAYLWSTTGVYAPALPWPNGVYNVRAEARDEAGNWNVTPGTTKVYVDNGEPDITLVTNPSDFAYVTSVVPVIFNYDPDYGLLAVTKVMYYDSGSSLIGSDIVTHTLGSAVATTAILTSVDTRGIPNGSQQIRASATDHAANAGSTGFWPMEVCNRELQLASIVRIPQGFNGDVQIFGSLVQNTSSGSQGPPGGGWAITVDVNDEDGEAFQNIFSVTDSAGAFSVTTINNTIQGGDVVDVTVTNTDSGCDSYFEVNPPLDLIQKSLSGTL